MKPYLRSALQGSLAAVAILASSVAAQAKTPADTLVMAYIIDDIISLDPAEIYEFTSSEYMANTYDRLVVIDPANPTQLKLQL
ncbi:MAG TPA: ABC transporter substrate-binding protein, partial [Dongiaceae bacterium]|nr:ABC transporter substrate-binding protein [Dongiaceae bacterium]